MKKRARRNSARAFIDSSLITITDACILWPYGTNDKGYGQVHVGDKSLYVHRIAYEKTVGPIPPGKELMHSCDIPACFNPRHLSPALHIDNMLDASAKGRMHKHYKHGPETQAQIVAAGSSVSSYRLAKRLGIPASTIRIIRQKLRIRSTASSGYRYSR